MESWLEGMHFRLSAMLVELRFWLEMERVASSRTIPVFPENQSKHTIQTCSQTTQTLVNFLSSEPPVLPSFKLSLCVRLGPLWLAAFADGLMVELLTPISVAW